MMNGSLLFKAAPLSRSFFLSFFLTPSLPPFSQSKQQPSVFIELFDVIKKVSLKENSTVFVINDML